MAIPLNGRMTVYTNEVPFEVDILQTGLYKMVGDSHLAECILGTGLNNPDLFNGLPCLPISPPGLSVTVNEGRLYHYEVMDATSWSALPANTTNYLYKQFIHFDIQTFTTPAPTTVGNSVIHLIQGAPVTADDDVTSRPYFNSADPTMPIFNVVSGVRSDNLVITRKLGVEGISPSVPTPDPGFIGLYAVTVNYGQTVIVTGDIAYYAGTQFVLESLNQKISQATVDANYVSQSAEQDCTYIYGSDIGSVNNITVNCSPPYGTPVAGQRVFVQTQYTNTGATSITINGHTRTVRKMVPGGVGNEALTGGEIAGNGSAATATGIYEFVYNGTYFILLNPAAPAAVSPIPTGAIMPFGGASAPAGGWLMCDGSAVSRTTYSALFAEIGTAFGAGNGTTTFNVPSTPRRTLVGAGGSGTGTLGNAVGNTGGAETHTQTEAEIAAHSHAGSTVDTVIGIGGTDVGVIHITDGVSPSTTPLNIASDGSATPFNIMQPSLVVNYIIKT